MIRGIVGRFLFPVTAVLIFVLISFESAAQGEVSGTVYDKTTGETLIGASVIIQGTSKGVTTDIDGNFTLSVSQPFPVVLEIAFLGYQKQEITVEKPASKLKIRLGTDSKMLDAVEIVDSRVTQRQQQEPLTVETMDVIAIQQAPSGNFYESLGTLKGVDMTSASLGFKVINTRGFNSTSPVRTLQVIDGVDNQSPGLNFSLGNFLGASDLDVERVNIVAGANSAYYGPGAFNGVIDMKTKDPFIHQGLSASLKYGERSLFEGAVRWAHVYKNKKGEEKFAVKLNAFYLQANDWEAENYDPVFESGTPRDNPGGYDAVNIYGDEDVASNNDFTSPLGAIEAPGLGKFHRTGYREIDLADYNTRNAKLNAELHYKFKKDLRLIMASAYSQGTTVYQGDNRYSLNGIRFFQNKLEMRKDDKWFVRAYATNEDAGDSYDIVTTAFRLQEDIREDRRWNTAYSTNYAERYVGRVRSLPDFPNRFDYETLEEWQQQGLDPFLANYRDSLMLWHGQNRAQVDAPGGDNDRYEPGTARFDSAAQSIRGRKFTNNGSRFFDKSALYHFHSEYKFKPSWADITVGASGRLYRPNSEGTIFSDTMTYERLQTDTGTVITDSSYTRISNYEYGVYAGIERDFMKEKLKAKAVLRMDKNENFDYVFSPALTLVYSPDENHTFRTNFSSAVRNPTLADQYLNYNVGRAILLGNLNGFDSLVTTESLENFANTLNRDTLEYFNVAPIRPEQVRTIEFGYRGIFKNKLYVDASYYHSWYTDFIGFEIGVDIDITTLNTISRLQPYRLAANARGTVTTQGFSIGGNYYLGKRLNLSANYSWNKLITGDDDPIIPAFNTPEHKYNLGISGKDIMPGWLPLAGTFGFGVNYKWLQGFIFEGSPQFTGPIDSYGLLDAQVNYNWPRLNTTFKLGASNLLNNMVYQVYGGPRVGRLAYFSILYDFKKR